MRERVQLHVHTLEVYAIADNENKNTIVTPKTIFNKRAYFDTAFS
jgi:hypothetical protein